jgi:hypothetical protein
MILDWEMQKFSYSNPYQVKISILLIILFSAPFILYFMGFYASSGSGEDAEGPPIVCFITMLILFIILFVIFFSPIVTHHALESDKLILKLGVLFYGEVPLENIKKIDHSPKSIGHIGTKVETKKHELHICTTPKNQIIIELKKPQKFGRVAFNKYVKYIFLTADYPDEMIIAVKNNMNRLGLEVV